MPIVGLTAPSQVPVRAVLRFSLEIQLRRIGISPPLLPAPVPLPRNAGRAPDERYLYCARGGLRRHEHRVLRTLLPARDQSYGSLEFALWPGADRVDRLGGTKHYLYLQRQHHRRRRLHTCIDNRHSQPQDPALQPDQWNPRQQRLSDLPRRDLRGWLDHRDEHSHAAFNREVYCGCWRLRRH